MRISNEIKSGLVIIAAILVGVYYFTKTANFQTQTYNIKTYFKYAGNLEADAVVKLAGIEAGRVKNINFVYTPETMVECVMVLNSGIKIRKDSIAYIGTAGFVGDAFIGITRGTNEEFLKDGDTVTSEEPIEMRELMKKADDIASNLDKILVDVKSIVVDNREGVNSIVSNLEFTTQNFKEFSEDVKKHPWKLLFKGE